MEDEALQRPVPPELQSAMVELELEYIERGYPALPQNAGGIAANAVRGWERLIESIGSYRGDSFEYMHTVNRRGRVYEISMLAREYEAFDVLDWLLPIVEAHDEGYREKTTPDVDRLFWQAKNHPAYWWERRLPKDERLMEQFRNDPRSAKDWR